MSRAMVVVVVDRLLVLVALLAGCGDDASVSPSAATAADLYGQWERPGTGGSRMFSFREHGVFHPALAGKTNVFVIYDTFATVQLPRIMGTYRVENGVIVQQPVWVEETGTLTNAAELRNDLLSLTKGATLTIEGGDGLPSTYTHIDGCRVPADATAWRAHLLDGAVWSPVSGGGRLATTMTFDAEGGLVATAANVVARYDDECIPEVAVNAATDTSGEAFVAPTAGGTHVVVGPLFGASGSDTTYSLLTPGMLTVGTRTVPIDGRAILDVTDLGGKVGILTKAISGGALTLVRDDGASFTQTPLTNLPQVFTAHQLIDGGNGRAVIVGTGDVNGTQGMYVVEETAPGTFTPTVLPFATFPSYMAAASENGDLWIVYPTGTQFPVGVSSMLNLATRRGGTWTTRPTVIGARPELIVKDGVAHLATLTFVQGLLAANTYYTRIEGDDVTSWNVPPWGGIPTGGTLGRPIANPAIAVADDGRVALGFQSRFHLRTADERDARTAPVMITITGSGRVTSRDGLIDCTATCTAMVEVGKRLLLTATPTNAGTTYLSCGSNGDSDANDTKNCNVDAVPPMGDPPMQDPVVARAMFP